VEEQIACYKVERKKKTPQDKKTTKDKEESDSAT